MMMRRSFVVEEGFRRTLMEAGIMSEEDVFRLETGRELAKANMPRWRKRIELRTSDGSTFYVKRYEKPAISKQIANWFSHAWIGSYASFDVRPAAALARAGIQTPRIAAYGEEWGFFFEKRSFSITEKIACGEALERRLPTCFRDRSPAGLREKRLFLRRLGQWAARFHQSGWRHRDFYLSHIFLTEMGDLVLIDLQRAFQPEYLAERFRRKDLAQLYYSLPRADFSRTDRLRIYLAYTGRRRLRASDRKVIRSVLRRAAGMARHDERHGRSAPYKVESGSTRP